MEGRLKNMVHPVIRLLMRIAAAAYFEKVIVKGRSNIPAHGPCIFACNHPNSFLDALIITVIYGQPIYYLARGDAFKRPIGAKLLRFLNNIPMFRKEEGSEHMPRNMESFSYCNQVLKNGDAVLIFSEGVCENEWHLRPFRKGTARLVFEALRDKTLSEKMKVIPVAVNYSGWLGAGNKIYVDFLPALNLEELPREQGLFLRGFNQRLRNALAEKCVSMDKGKDAETQNVVTGFIMKNLRNGTEKAMKTLELFKQQQGAPDGDRVKKLAGYIVNEKVRYYSETRVSLPAFLFSVLIIPVAVILNFIPYCLCRYIAGKTTRRNVFYDSVFFGSLVILGTFYMIILGILFIVILHSALGLAVPAMALFSAAYFEFALRNIYCFLTPVKQKQIKAMLSALP